MFHCHGDSGEKRLSLTSSPEVINSKTEKCSSKRKDITDDRRVNLFKSDTVTTLNNLYHITASCLLNIPPGATS